MKASHYERMRRIILISMILVPFIPFFIILSIGYFAFTSSLESSTLATMRRIVSDHRQMIAGFLGERRADLTFIAETHAFEYLRQPDNLHFVFKNLQRQSGAFVDIGIFDESGLHLAYQGPFLLAGKRYDQEEWFKEVMKTGYYISDIFMGFRNAPHFIIAVVRREQDRQWIIRATIDPYTFSDIVRQVRVGKTGEAYIVSAGGLFQTERRSGGGLMRKDPDYLRYGPPHEGIRTYVRADAAGETYVYATTWLKDGKWMLVVRQEKADAFAALRSAGYRIFLIMVVGGCAIIAAAFYMTGWIIRRMKRVDTEKDRLEEQLIRAHRLAELGEMSAGFAHEINNPLQIVRSEQALIEMNLSDLKLPEDGPEMKEIRDSLNQIKLQLNRCAGITQAILKFGRKTDAKAEDVDLRKFLPEVVAMVAKKAEVHGIDLTHRIDGATAPVKGDSGQLQQVMLNLLNNAMDAILAAHGPQGGILKVEAGPWRDDRVEIRVIDNGCGISPENQARIFSPFFTTKPVGQGTGLGLSICYGIIGNMGGVMEIKSKEGDGATAIVRLPASRAARAA